MPDPTPAADEIGQLDDSGDPRLDANYFFRMIRGLLGFGGRGIIPPSLTTAERDAIVSPRLGETIVNSDTGFLNVYFDNGVDSPTWRELEFVRPAVQQIAADYIIPRTKRLIFVDATGANRTATLPNAVGFAGERHRVFNVASNANTVTVDSAGGDVQCGSSYVLAAHESAEFCSDGARWWK